MNDEVDPVVGRWYRRADNDEAFMIVSIDADDDLIEIENVDGEREQMDVSAWADLDLESIDEPAEWVGRPEDLESDDLDHKETDVADWRDSDDDEDDDDDWDGLSVDDDDEV